jgi:hypothetical protein
MKGGAMIPGMMKLEKNELVTIRRGGRGDVLTCLSGLVWITCRGCPADLVLGAGKNTALTGHRDICIQALAGSLIRIGQAESEVTAQSPHLDAAIA